MSINNSFDVRKKMSGMFFHLSCDVWCSTAPSSMRYLRTKDVTNSYVGKDSRDTFLVYHEDVKSNVLASCVIFYENRSLDENNQLPSEIRP